MIVQPHPGHHPQNERAQKQLQAELLDLAARNPLTRRIQEVIIRDKPLPVDIRHNSKIFREQLAQELIFP